MRPLTRRRGRVNGPEMNAFGRDAPAQPSRRPQSSPVCSIFSMDRDRAVPVPLLGSGAARCAIFSPLNPTRSPVPRTSNEFPLSKALV